MPNVVLLCGAGSSKSGTSSNTPDAQPPLDHGFFGQCVDISIAPQKLDSVWSYIDAEFGYDIVDPEFDSFEFVMSILYADMFTSVHSNNSYDRFVELIELLSERISLSTAKAGRNQNLESVIRSCFKRSQASVLQEEEEKLEEVRSAGDFSIVTFNYDIQSELSLDSISTSNTKPPGFKFEFPACYRIPMQYIYSYYPGSGPGRINQFGSTSTSTPAMSTTAQQGPGIEVLKLHGSLNWDSGHKSYPPRMNSILRKSRTLVIALYALPKQTQRKWVPSNRPSSLR